MILDLLSFVALRCCLSFFFFFFPPAPKKIIKLLSPTSFHCRVFLLSPPPFPLPPPLSPPIDLMHEHFTHKEQTEPNCKQKQKTSLNYNKLRFFKIPKSDDFFLSSKKKKEKRTFTPFPFLQSSPCSLFRNRMFLIFPDLVVILVLVDLRCCSCLCRCWNSR